MFARWWCVTSPKLPFANGWYRVATSDEIVPGAVLPLRFFGRELVLLRTAAGDARVLDAFCPHLGAHFGYGGVVEGETIVCPFHGWRFSDDGVCVNVPYAKTPPPLVGKKCIRSWPVTERNQCIYVWYHARGQSPAYEVQAIPELAAPDEWTDMVWKQWTIRCQAIDVVENLFDVAHVKPVHKSDADVQCQFDGYRSVITANPAGRRRHGTVLTYLNGPGQGWSRHDQLLPFLVLTHVTPIDHEQVVWHIGVTISRAKNRDKDSIKAWIVNVVHHLAEQDIPIFEHKVHRVSPPLCEEDALIGDFRAWYQQFCDEPAREVTPQFARADVAEMGASIVHTFLRAGDE